MLCIEHEHAASAAFELEPGERYIWISLNERLFRVADFDDQYA